MAGGAAAGGALQMRVCHVRCGACDIDKSILCRVLGARCRRTIRAGRHATVAERRAAPAAVYWTRLRGEEVYMTLRSGAGGGGGRDAGRARGHHSVRFHGDDMPNYKSLESDSAGCGTGCGGSGPASCPAEGGTSPAPDACSFTPAAQRLRLNEQRIKLLTSINQVVSQRAELESNRGALATLLDELRRKLRRRIDEHHADKKDRMKALKGANLRLERDKYTLMSEVEHLRRHLDREEAHHLQHARTAVAQAIQGVVSRELPAGCSLGDLPSAVSRSVARNAPSRLADNKLAAARLMRDIAELRQRVAQVEARLAQELKRKRQAELDIVRLRKELSATKSCVASLRLPAHHHRDKCSKFA